MRPKLVHYIVLMTFYVSQPQCMLGTRPPAGPSGETPVGGFPGRGGGMCCLSPRPCRAELQHLSGLAVYGVLQGEVCPLSSCGTWCGIERYKHAPEGACPGINDTSVHFPSASILRWTSAIQFDPLGLGPNR